jgi:hypothetical protein
MPSTWFHDFGTGFTAHRKARTVEVRAAHAAYFLGLTETAEPLPAGKGRGHRGTAGRGAGHVLDRLGGTRAEAIQVAVGAFVATHGK